MRVVSSQELGVRGKQGVSSQKLGVRGKQVVSSQESGIREFPIPYLLAPDYLHRMVK